MVIMLSRRLKREHNYADIRNMNIEHNCKTESQHLISKARNTRCVMRKINPGARIFYFRSKTRCMARSCYDMFSLATAKSYKNLMPQEQIRTLASNDLETHLINRNFVL